jgi:heme/copper-type cytochrome/quinol oxidase subunit 2
VSEQTKQALEQFVQKMLAGAEQAGAFAVEQTPLLVQEWLRWQLVSSLLMAIVLVVPTLVLLFVGWRYRQSIWEDEHPLPVFAFVLSLIPGVAMAVNIIHATKVYIAPRVVILEMFAHLVQQ